MDDNKLAALLLREIKEMETLENLSNEKLIDLFIGCGLFEKMVSVLIIGSTEDNIFAEILSRVDPNWFSEKAEQRRKDELLLLQ